MGTKIQIGGMPFEIEKVEKEFGLKDHMKDKHGETK